MLHKMKLNESPFERIKNGSKTMEFRLYDEKRQKVKIGDKIEFSKLPDLQEYAISESCFAALICCILQALVGLARATNCEPLFFCGRKEHNVGHTRNPESPEPCERLLWQHHAVGETSRHCTQYDFILVQREDKKYQRTALVQASERGIGSFHGGFRRKKKRAGAERGLLCSLHSIHAV